MKGRRHVNRAGREMIAVAQGQTTTGALPAQVKTGIELLTLEEALAPLPAGS